MLAGDTNGQVAAWSGMLFLWAVALTGSAAALWGRRVRVLPVELLVGLSTVSQPRRLVPVLLLAGLVPQLWLMAFIVAPPEGMTPDGHMIVPAELVVLALWLVYLVRTPRLPPTPSGLLDALPEPSAAHRDAAQPSPNTRSGGGILWAVVGVVLVCLTLYAAFATPALYGEESSTGTFLVYGVGGGVLLILWGARRGIVLPNGWRLPSSARAGAVLVSVVLFVGIVDSFGGTGWAVLVGLVSVVIVPLLWRATARTSRQ
jgi:hypothetical protein